MEEEWRPIKNYEGLYEISNLGRVKSLNYRRTGKENVLKPRKQKKGGYLQIILCKNGMKKMVSVHRLVAEAFIPNPDNKPCIDHINTIRDDNRVENLRWTTYEENMNNELTKEHRSDSLKDREFSEEHRRKISEGKQGNIPWNKGKCHSEETKKKISESKKSTKIICIFPDGTQTEPMCQKELSKYLDINRRTIGELSKTNKPYNPKRKNEHLRGIILKLL